MRLDPQRHHDVVILGGDDHKTGQESDTAERFAQLERVLEDLVPDVTLSHRWSGQVIETSDGLPYMGTLD